MRSVWRGFDQFVDFVQEGEESLRVLVVFIAPEEGDDVILVECRQDVLIHPGLEGDESASFVQKKR